MRRTIIGLVFAVAVAGSGLSAFGIGGAFSAGVLGGIPNSALLSLKLDNLPLIGIGATIGGSTTSIGATVDWWLYHQDLGGPFSLYVGAGGYLDANGGTIGVGARLPIGLQFFPIKPLELFIEGAPRAGLIFASPIQFPVWGVQAAVGFRFWLK